MKCHYDILNLSRDADDSEIKTAYRKLALKWHPDKNIDNPTLAKEQFQLVQQAYEVLSDRQERAWYDKYREQILRGGSEGKFQDDSLDVFQYFTSSCFKGYNDNEDGFYTVYRTVFDKLSAEDIEYHETESDAENIPNFGNSTSDYDTVVGPFYAYWMAYSTKKSYVWLDTHDIRETRDRKVIKMMEKENKKIRIKAKKERNEEVRSLVSYVRKRDKRVQAYNKMLEAKALENRIKQEELRKQRLIERNKELDEAKKKQQEWSKFENMKSELKEIEKSLAEQFGEAISDSDIESDCEDLIENNLYCAACNKVFKTPKAFGNHESSKKHKSNVEKLRAEMLGEDDIEEEEVKEQSDLETIEVVLDKNNSDEEKSAKKSKKNKNKKKQNICNDVSDEETSLLNTSKLEKRSKKQKQNKTKSESDSDIPKDPDNLEKNVISEEEDIETFLLNGLSKKQKKKLNSKSLELSKVREEKVKQVNDSDSEENQCNGDTNNITKDSESKNIKAKKNRTKVDNIPSTEVNNCCIVCKNSFPSKNKLFQHLKSTGHSSPMSDFVPKAQKKQKMKNLK